MQLYFARHGETDANANMISGKPISELDEPLNAVGIQQAKELAEQLKNIKFDAIISSPLKRAYQTTELVNTYHNLPIEVIDELRERKANAYIDATTWNDLFNFDKHVTMGGVETLEDFFDRIYKIIDSLKQEYKGKTILAISHGGVQHALYAYSNDLPLVGNIRISPMKNCEYRLYEL